MFLELTGLNRFVAASYGPQQKVSVDIEESIAEFEKEEKKRLTERMEPKKITVCEDETFHPETCLAAIEPVSNFILLEKYAASRKADEWTISMKEAAEGLPIEVVQSTSDEGRGILHHVKEDLGAHHSPDTFHVQNELVKGTSGALASRKRKAEKAVEEAAKEVSRHREEKEAYSNGNPGPGRPPGFDKRIEDAQKKEDEVKKTLEIAEKHQECVQEAIQGISKSYHPYALETGNPQSTEDVSVSLEKRFSDIEKVASEADLPLSML